jgi:outer membrane protein assembly factor BamB
VNTFNSELIALNARDGAVLWRVHGNGNEIMSTPLVGGGMVFVGSGRNGRLVKVDADFTYTPNAGGNPIWGRPEGDALFAFDAGTGAPKWSYKTVGEDMPSPALTKGLLVFVNGDLHAYGLGAKDGKLAWKRSVNGLATMASATLSGGIVFTSYCRDAPYHCYTAGLNPVSGATIWQTPYGNSDSSPTVADGRVFVSGVEDTASPFEHGGRATVVALNALTGKPLWKYKTTSSGPYTEVGSSERAIAGAYWNGLYFQAIPSHDEIVAFDARNGHIRWRFRSIAPVKMSPIIAGGKLYIGDTAGILYSLLANTGSLYTTRHFAQPFTTSPPVLMGDSLFIANDTTVYALRIN